MSSNWLINMTWGYLHYDLNAEFILLPQDKLPYILEEVDLDE
jgi:hypothetical protein